MGCSGALKLICCAKCDTDREVTRRRRGKGKRFINRIRSRFPVVRAGGTTTTEPEATQHTSTTQLATSEERLAKDRTAPSSPDIYESDPRMTSKVIGSKSIGDASLKTYLSDSNGFASRDDVIIPKSAEYVKRTAKFFESNNHYMKATGTDSERSGDLTPPSPGDKKPSYLGVSCSNSGYRNVIKYDSKLREELWSSTNQRESLVLTRLRDSSPLKFDQDHHSTQNGHAPPTRGRSITTTTIIPSENGHGPQTTTTTSSHYRRSDEFVNISTSTKTISTFRSVAFTARDETDRGDAWRRSGTGYSSLGLTAKALKSPEKNCNSFLRSINSFESNCRKSQVEAGQSPVRRTQTTRSSVTYCSPSSSIQQRIERLYGPGALAQGFYTQTSSPRTRLKSETSEESAPASSRLKESIGQTIKSSIESIPDLLPAAPEVVLPIEQYTNGEEVADSSLSVETDEKNGRYFLKLLQKEINKLESLAAFAESELENGENLPEDASGKLRAAAGKARLLVRQKLHQFEGLCQKNLNEKPGEQFPTTSEDLAGFWDMVMLQVVQVYGVFDEIDKLKKNNWKPVTPTKEEKKSGDGEKKTARKSTTTTTTTTSSSATTPKDSNKDSKASLGGSTEKAEMAKKAREETRKKMMEERRRKMKELRENKTVNGGNDNEIEIFAK